VQDLYDPAAFDAKLEEVLEYHNFVLVNYLGGKAVDAAQVRDQLAKLKAQLFGASGDEALQPPV